MESHSCPQIELPMQRERTKAKTPVPVRNCAKQCSEGIKTDNYQRLFIQRKLLNIDYPPDTALFHNVIISLSSQKLFRDNG